MKTLLLALLISASAPVAASAATITMGDHPTVNQDSCLTQSDSSCPERHLGADGKLENAPASMSRVNMNLSSYRGPRGVPDSMLDEANPEFIPRARSTPHHEASVSVGVAQF